MDTPVESKRVRDTQGECHSGIGDVHMVWNADHTSRAMTTDFKSGSWQ